MCENARIARRVTPVVARLIAHKRLQKMRRGEINAMASCAVDTAIASYPTDISKL